MIARKIVLGVGGGIAAYKTAALASRLVQRGDDVWVVATKASFQFVGPATWAAISSHAPVSDGFDARFPRGPHIELAESCDALVIAPATARVMASCANGSADDLLATLYLQIESPVLVAPAMSDAMWSKPAVARNLNRLHADGVHTIGPNEGWLSCRRRGTGRMAEPDEILIALDALLERDTPRNESSSSS
jgi:phosphopantothenoylcysteine decarboxylase/phosphopantothenate--cysteine ligase